MATLLHLSFRVQSPASSAALYADLLGGRAESVGPPLDSIGVIVVRFGRNVDNVLLDQIEIWPAGKHWTEGGFVDVEPAAAPFGHFAVESDKTCEDIAAVAARHGVRFSMEERGLPYLVPVVYDHDGNFIELFRPR